MNRPKSFARGLVLLVAALAATSACGGGMTVAYDGARGPKRSKGDIAVYDLDCREPVQSTGDCTYNGGPVGWKTVGVFRTPSKALSNWGRYRVKAVETAANAGCPALAIRKVPPASSDGMAIGAFCVDPSASLGAAGNGAGNGAGTSVMPTATAQPAPIECNQPSDCPGGMKCMRGQCTP